MPRGLTFDLTAVATGPVVENLEGISHRMLHLQPIMPTVERVWERGEARLFAGLGGKYQDTGALLSSLTQPSANGAIRQHHADELVLGSSLPYAKYQRKGKKSAVLVLRPTEKKQAAKVIIDFIAEGHR